MIPFIKQECGCAADCGAQAGLMKKQVDSRQRLAEMETGLIGAIINPLEKRHA